MCKALILCVVEFYFKLKCWREWEQTKYTDFINKAGYSIFIILRIQAQSAYIRRFNLWLVPLSRAGISKPHLWWSWECVCGRNIALFVAKEAVIVFGSHVCSSKPRCGSVTLMVHSLTVGTLAFFILVLSYVFTWDINQKKYPVRWFLNYCGKTWWEQQLFFFFFRSMYFLVASGEVHISVGK